MTQLAFPVTRLSSAPLHQPVCLGAVCVFASIEMRNTQTSVTPVNSWTFEKPSGLPRHGSMPGRFRTAGADGAHAWA